MKPDFTFALEQAGWPAFLVDESGTIRKANEAAILVLGAVLEGDPALSASIWSPENGLTAEEYVARLELGSPPVTVLRFRVKGGATHSFHTFICPTHREGERVFLFQLLPEVPGGPQAYTLPAMANLETRACELVAVP